jgi:DNA-directed RNA polymerase subunit RPC12/RpoP
LKQNESEKIVKTIETCPHCGHPLSPWQQVLLGVDRALVCKNCWYRIILDTPLKEKPQADKGQEPSKPEG